MLVEDPDWLHVLAEHGDGVDALIDPVSFDADSLRRLAATVREGGGIASTVNPATPETVAAHGLTGTIVMATPKPRAPHGAHRRRTSRRPSARGDGAA